MSKLLIAAVSLALLAGCRKDVKSEPPIVPRVVTTTVTQYVPLPEALTRDCRDEPAQQQTYEEAKRLALVRRHYLAECTERLRRIRALQRDAP